MRVRKRLRCGTLISRSGNEFRRGRQAGRQERREGGRERGRKRELKKEKRDPAGTVKEERTEEKEKEAAEGRERR